MEEKKIGFIGFGEVGRTFAREMKSKGARLFYFDIMGDRHEDWIEYLPLKELLQTCQIILSTVTTDVAKSVAKTAAAFLGPGKTYADLNSTSVEVKKQVAEIIMKTPANFVEGAILSAVGEAGARAAILVAGPKAEEFARVMNQLGLVNLKSFSTKIGDASQVKMIRSVFSKGLECLLLEMMVAAKRAGIADYVWGEIVEFMSKNSFERVAANWVKTHPAACERRYHEMVQVVETLEGLRVEPIMSSGTKNFFAKSLQLNLARQFPQKPENFWEVPEFIADSMK